MEPEYTKAQYYIMTGVIFSQLFFEGIYDNSKSVTLPNIKEVFDASYTLYGVLTGLTSLSYVVCSVLGFLFVKKLTFKWTIVVGNIISLIGTIYMVFVPDMTNALVAMFLSSSILGFADVTSNAVGTIIFKEHTATMISLLNFCYGVGAVVAPFISSYIMTSSEYQFRAVYAVLTIVSVILILVYSLVPFPVKEPPATIDKVEGTQLTIYKAYINPMVWFFAITLMVVTQVERSAMLWGGVYIQDVLHLDPQVEGALFNTLFYVCFTIARFVGGFIEEKIGLLPSFVGILVLCILFLVVGFCLGQVGLWILCCTGFFAGLFWPTVMCICIEYFDDSAPTATSAMLPITFLLLTVLQVLLGNLNDILGPEWAYRSSVVFLLIGLVLTFFIYRLMKKRKDKIKLLQEQVEPIVNV